MEFTTLIAASELLIVRKAIRDRLALALPGMSVEEFPRAQLITEDVDEALKGRVLAVRVAFTGITPGSELNSNELDAPCVFSVFVAAMDRANTPTRDLIALAVLPIVMRTVATGNWAPKGSAVEVDEQRVEKLGARQLYAGEVDTKSVCLWVVDWHQRITLKPPPPSDLRELLTLITRYDLVPKDGTYEAVDNIDMRHDEEP